jgi:hypothetical protein
MKDIAEQHAVRGKSGLADAVNANKPLNPKRRIIRMESIKTSIAAPAIQQDHKTEAQVLQTCARAGVCCIGIQSGFGIKADLVLFQPTVTTLAIPLAEFANPERAIDLIQAKLAQ